MARHLIVGEENPNISGMLYDYFAEREYQVQTVDTAPAVLAAAGSTLPSLVILSASLSGADPHDLIHQLRALPRTSHVPIVCLAPLDHYNEMLSVLEAGADDCIAKPFDLEELGLRVENAIMRSERENVVDPRSGLPGARLLEDHVQRLSGTDGWTYLDLKIEHFEPFREVNGFVAADQVLQMMPGFLRDTVLAHGSDQDYLSHPADDHFVLVTFAPDTGPLTADLTNRFNEAVLTHYSFMDREMGYMTVYRGDEEVQVPLMVLTATPVSPEQLFFDSNS
jgi:PleD family two-component response regulator